MGIKFGDIDVGQIIDNEYRSKFVAKILDWLFNNNRTLVRPSPDEVEKIKQEVVSELQEKYPNMGVKLTNEPKQK
jgi:hypothetical protein